MNYELFQKFRLKLILIAATALSKTYLLRRTLPGTLSLSLLFAIHVSC